MTMAMGTATTMTRVTIMATPMTAPTGTATATPGMTTARRRVTGSGWKSFAALGLSGGLVPSASAVVLLLGAVHLGRVGLGLVLVAAFGVGNGLRPHRRRDAGGAGSQSRGPGCCPTGSARSSVTALPVVMGIVVLGAGVYMTWSAVADVGAL